MASTEPQRVLYSLSQADSTAWLRGGPEAAAVQHRLWEAHQRAGLPGPLDILHPDGTRASHFLPEPLLAQGQAPRPHTTPPGFLAPEGLSQSRQPLDPADTAGTC